MDITQPVRFRFTPPTTRANGRPIVGALSYIFELTDTDGNVVHTIVSVTTVPSDEVPGAVETSFAFDGAVDVGDYVGYFRSVEDTGSGGVIGARSTGVPFTLDDLAPPNPPTGVVLIA